MRIKTIKQIGFVLTLTVMLITSKIQAQDSAMHVKEFGIGLANLSSFSLQYRWGNEHRLYRISGNLGGTGSTGKSTNNVSYILGNNSSTSNKTGTPINLNVGLSFSLLKIKPVSEKVGLLYGGICSLSYSINESTNISYSPQAFNNSITTYKTKNYSQGFIPSLGLALGAVYKINSSFLVYAEIDPNIYYSYSNTKMTRTYSSTDPTYNTSTEKNSGSTNSFGLSNLSNSNATLTIVYRITK